MSNSRDDASPSSDAAAKRRWMITLLITLVFGGFGAVMAWLSYAKRDESSSTAPAAKRSSPPATTEPASAPDPEPPGRGKGKPDK